VVYYMYLTHFRTLQLICRGGSRGCPGCPDTRPLLRMPFFENNIFSKHVLAKQGASQLNI